MLWAGNNRAGQVSDAAVQPSGQVAARPLPQTLPSPETDSQPPIRPLIVVLGPTAIGKTALAIALAQAVNGEIVSADSRQIYRHMDIGTAKPSPRERALVAHHLIDMVDPDETFTLAQYQLAAYAIIDSIAARDRVPLLVGGTGQYLSAVVEGWGIPEVPPNTDLRAQLEDVVRDQGARALHSRLQAVDPHAAERIDYRNVRRVIRALEVYYETGTPITVLQHKTPPPYRILQLGLTMPRPDLYARVDARIDRMIQDGLANEVRTLHHEGYTWECSAMSGLGYAQWRSHFEGRTSLDAVIAAIRRDTRAFVRRQYTWFKGHDTEIVWQDLSQTAPAAIIEWSANWLTGKGD